MKIRIVPSVVGLIAVVLQQEMFVALDSVSLKPSYMIYYTDFHGAGYW